jgi:hypothetical protein
MRHCIFAVMITTRFIWRMQSGICIRGEPVASLHCKWIPNAAIKLNNCCAHFICAAASATKQTHNARPSSP